MKRPHPYQMLMVSVAVSCLFFGSIFAGVPEKVTGTGNGPIAVVPDGAQSIQVPEIVVYGVNQASGPQTDFAGDVLVADRIPDIEGNPDMVSSDLWGMFLVTESMDMSNTNINVYRSVDGGESWSHYLNIVGGAPNEIRDPALALPENTQDHLYIVYEYVNQIQVVQFDLSTLNYFFYNVDSNSLGVHYPRIVTDDLDYPGNYWVYVTYAAGTLLAPQDGYRVMAARSTDDGATWGNHTVLYTTDWGGPCPVPDIAWGETTLHVTWAGNEPYPGTGLDIFVSRSTDLGASWSSAVNLTTSSAQSCYDPRMAAIRGDETSGGEVVVAYTKEYPGDPDVWYNYSTDRGATWGSQYCLACSSSANEQSPDLDADPSYGYFHLAYWQDNNIMYSQAHRSTPTTWSSTVMVSDTTQASLVYGRATTAYDWISGEHGVAWSDFRTATNAIYFDRKDWTVQTETLACSYTCEPSSGVVPFSTQMTVTMYNLYAGQTRRMAGRIDAALANGNYYSNWRSGFTNIAAGSSYVSAWSQNIPAAGGVIGANAFQLFSQDVTPAPYNQPPYPPAGDTDTSYCVVTGISP